MDAVAVAQAVLEKTTKITFPAKRADLFAKFAQVGISLSGDSKTVLDVSGNPESVFKNLYSSLGSPTVKLACKRAMASKGVNV